MPYEELLLVHVGGNGDVEKANHHFVVGLISPAHGSIGIGIVLVVAASYRYQAMACSSVPALRRRGSASR